MTSFGRWTAASAAALVLLLGMASTALAHEHRQVGKYELTVGFLTEPALQGQPNGVDLRVKNVETDQPVTGLENTLKVTVSYGGGPAREFSLRPRFNTPGAYNAEFIPTRPGTYVFTFVGTIEGQEVNERFESGPGRFNNVQPASELMFPEVDPLPGELADLARQAQADAQSAVQRATLFGVAGIAVGAIGVVLAVVALAVSGRKTTSLGTH
ncbi:MAG TPA: hypothetical protein VIN09_00040 [Chloroflexota bacterium]